MAASDLLRQAGPAALVILVAVTGCAAYLPPQLNGANVTADWVELRTVSTYDQFDQATKIESPQLRSGSTRITLFAVRSRGSAKHRFAILVLNVHGGDWHFYTRAQDHHGESFPMDRAADDVTCSGGSCTYYEAVSISVDERILRRQAVATTGWTIRVSGQRGRMLFTIPPHVIEGFLRKVDRPVSDPEPMPLGSAHGRGVRGLAFS